MLQDFDEKRPTTKAERVAHISQRHFQQGVRIFVCQHTSIHKCAERDDLAGFKEFRSGLHPVPIDEPDRAGNSCLILASQRGFASFVAALLADGADTNVANNKGQTAMHAAVVGRHAAVVRALYQAGASVLARDNTGALPAHYAAQANDASMLEVLFECRTPDDEEARRTILEGTMNAGMTPAHSAALFDSPQALEYLHSVGCDLEARDSCGDTCAHKASRVQALSALQVLRGLGVSFLVKNNDDETPDQLARDID